MKLAKYRFDIRPRSELILPAYKGSTFRGGFGHAFKRAVCVERAGECAKCKLQHKCVYSYVFETASPEAETQNTQVPHPFVIEPPLEERQRYGIEDRLSFQLILVCRAIDYIPYFIFAFEELGRIGLGRNRGEYKLEKVVSSGTNDSEALIYDGKSHIRDDSQLIDLDHLFRGHVATQLPSNHSKVPHLHEDKIPWQTYQGYRVRATNSESIETAIVARRGSL